MTPKEKLQEDAKNFRWGCGCLLILIALSYGWYWVSDARKDPILIRQEQDAAKQAAEHFKAGYLMGYPVGALWGSAHQDVPTEIELNQSAERAYAQYGNGVDKTNWVDGYKIGFEDGYKKLTKKAF